MVHKYDTKGYFPGYRNLPEYGRSGKKHVEIHAEIQDMEIFQYMKNYPVYGNYHFNGNYTFYGS